MSITVPASLPPAAILCYLVFLGPLLCTATSFTTMYPYPAIYCSFPLQAESPPLLWLHLSFRNPCCSSLSCRSLLPCMSVAPSFNVSRTSHSCQSPLPFVLVAPSFCFDRSFLRSCLSDRSASFLLFQSVRPRVFGRSFLLYRSLLPFMSVAPSFAIDRVAPSLHIICTFLVYWSLLPSLLVVPSFPVRATNRRHDATTEGRHDPITYRSCKPRKMEGATQMSMESATDLRLEAANLEGSKARFAATESAAWSAAPYRREQRSGKKKRISN